MGIDQKELIKVSSAIRDVYEQASKRWSVVDDDRMRAALELLPAGCQVTVRYKTTYDSERGTRNWGTRHSEKDIIRHYRDGSWGAESECIAAGKCILFKTAQHIFLNACRSIEPRISVENIPEQNAVITISREEAERIRRLLTIEPATEQECLPEGDTIVHTARFQDGIEMDVKCCGVQYREGESNLAWTEAVLFRNGAEVACSEVSDGYLGIWTLEYNGTYYTVTVGLE